MGSFFLSRHGHLLLRCGIADELADCERWGRLEIAAI